MKRITKQRLAIMDSFKSFNRPLSVEEILKNACAIVPQLNLATVYRNIKLLLEEGLITTVNLPGNNARYECVGLEHHHHFLCNDCNRLFDVEGCPEGLTTLVPKGFKLKTHAITLTGTCMDCS